MTEALQGGLSRSHLSWHLATVALCIEGTAAASPRRCRAVSSGTDCLTTDAEVIDTLQMCAQKVGKSVIVCFTILLPAWLRHHRAAYDGGRTAAAAAGDAAGAGVGCTAARLALYAASPAQR